MQTNFPIQPFLFDRTFNGTSRSATSPHRRTGDAKELALEVESLRRKIATISEMHSNELDLTRREAFEAGLEHARNERESAVLASVDALQASLEAVSEQFTDLRIEVVAQAGELAIAAAEALAGHAVALAPGRAIDEAIGRALAQVTRGEEIEVRVHPDLTEEIERRIADRQRGDRRRLHICVNADAGVAPGDALLKWERGGISLNAADRRQMVIDEIGPLLAGSEG